MNKKNKVTTTLLVGRTGCGKSVFLMKNIKEKKKTSGYTPLVIFPEHHHADVEELKELGVDLKIVPDGLNSDIQIDTDRIFKVLNIALEGNQDIYIDDIPMDLKNDLIAYYFSYIIKHQCKSNLYVTLQTLSQLNNPLFMVKLFTNIMVWRSEDMVSLEFYKEQFHLLFEDVKDLETGEFIEVKSGFSREKTLREKIDALTDEKIYDIADLVELKDIKNKSFVSRFFASGHLVGAVLALLVAITAFKFVFLQAADQNVDGLIHVSQISKHYSETYENKLHDLNNTIKKGLIDEKE